MRAPCSGSQARALLPIYTLSALSALSATAARCVVCLRHVARAAAEHADAGCSRGAEQADGSNSHVMWLARSAGAAATLAAQQLQCAALCSFAA